MASLFRTLPSICVTFWAVCSYGGQQESPLAKWPGIDVLLEIDTSRKDIDICSLSLSPEGSRLLFTTRLGGEIVEVATGNRRSLRLEEAVEVMCWSNSGTFVLLRSRGEASPVLYDLSSHRWDTLAEGVALLREAQYRRRREKKDWVLYRHRRRGWQAISDPGVSVTGFAVSPDGSRVMIDYVAKEEVFDARLEKRYELPRGAYHVWSQEGKDLLYVQQKDDGHFVTSSSLQMVSFDGTNTNSQVIVPWGPYEIRNLSSARGGIIAFSWGEPSTRETTPSRKLLVARLRKGDGGK